MNGAGFRIETERRWLYALAALALLMQVLVPQGFMVNADHGAPGLVICTGHGPLALGQNDHSGKAPKSAGNPCAFAVHGGTAPPPSVARLDRVRFDPAPATLARAFDLVPGRGLAAPPPPSQGPPTRLI
jgi:hypothetical protein